MKKYFFALALLLSSIPTSFAAYCDETFYGSLRLGNSYYFGDIFTNLSTNREGVVSVRPQIEEQYDYDQGPHTYHFNWTPWISGKGFIINPGESGEYLLSQEAYPIHAYPQVRSQNNLMVRYEVDYKSEINGTWEPNVTTHNECKYYEITRCGDGILDQWDGEQCDLGAQNGQPGSGCNSACMPIQAPPCIPGATVGVQTSPVNSFTPGLCPVGESVDSFTAIVSGGTTNYSWGCNGSLVGGACTASYTNQGLFDLSIKKYIAGNDAQTSAAAFMTATGTNFDYTLVITNNGPGTASGVTAVTDDTIPSNVQLVGTPTGIGWACNLVAGGFTCTRSDDLLSGQTYSTITAPAMVPTGLLGATFGNTAFVSNPNENPLNNYGNNNSDPAWVGVGGSNNLCAPGSTRWAQTSPLNATSSGLCPVGESVDSFTVLVNGNTTSYSWGCNGSALGWACTASYTSGGGGGQSACSNLAGTIISNIGGTLTEQYTCSANTNLSGNLSYQIDCGNGTSFSGSNASGSFQATCSYPSGSITNMVVATCSIDNAAPGICQLSPLAGSTGGGGGGGGGWSGGGSSGFCGNGVVDTWQWETCDAGAVNGVHVNNGICNDCRLASTNPGGCIPGVSAPACPIGWTNPGAYGIHILLDGRAVSDYRAIVGNGVSVFDNNQFTLDTTFPVYVEGKTTTITNDESQSHISGSRVMGALSGCVGPNGSVIYLAEDKAVYCRNNVPLFTATNGSIQGVAFQWDTSNLVGDSALANETPLTDENFFVSVGYFTEPIPVRVSKPIISSIAWGNAMIGNGLGVTVNSVAESFIDQLKKGNFSLAANRLDYSATSAIGGTNSGSSQIVSIGQFTNTTSGNLIKKDVRVLQVSDLENNPDSFVYGANNTVIKLPKGDLTIDTNLSISGVKTIILEEGNLIINKNITYSNANASIAFVVKRGDILIDRDVEKISWVYIDLNGKITGQGGTTTVQLVIDGNIYGKMNELVGYRTYVRGLNSSSALTTGVTVNYSTRAIKNPPPLLSDFLDQYELGRITQ